MSCGSSLHRGYENCQCSRCQRAHCRHCHPPPPRSVRCADILDQPIASTGDGFDLESTNSLCDFPELRNGAIDDVFANETPVPAMIDQHLSGDHNPAMAG